MPPVSTGTLRTTPEYDSFDGPVWRLVTETDREGRRRRPGLRGVDTRGRKKEVPEEVCHNLELEEVQEQGDRSRSSEDFYASDQGSEISPYSSGASSSLGAPCLAPLLPISPMTGRKPPDLSFIRPSLHKYSKGITKILLFTYSF